YRAAFPLSPEARAALEDVLIERLLIEVRYFTRMSLQRGRAFDPEGTRRRYRLAAHLLDSRRPAARATPPPVSRAAAGGGPPRRSNAGQLLEPLAGFGRQPPARDQELPAGTAELAPQHR